MRSVTPPKQAAEQRLSTTAPVPMAACLIPDPVLEEAAVNQLAAIHDLCLELRFAGVKGQGRRHRCDHVGKAKACGHNVRRIVLDGGAVMVVEMAVIAPSRLNRWSSKVR